MYRMYAMLDSDVKDKQYREILAKNNHEKFEKARELNKQHFAIFHTFNEIEGKQRLAKNVTKVNYWAADIDGGNKEEQLKLIDNQALKPSVIIESKNGYHTYYKAKNGTIENYHKIVSGIIDKLKADPSAKDPSRLLRVPGFYHWKDPNDPFLVKVYSSNNNVYDEDVMLYYFAKKEKEKKRKQAYNISKTEYTNPDNWEKIFKISNICKGERNNYMYWILRRLEDSKCSNADIRYIIEGINKKIVEPLSDAEINQLLRGRRVY